MVRPDGARNAGPRAAWQRLAGECLNKEAGDSLAHCPKRSVCAEEPSIRALEQVDARRLSEGKRGSEELQLPVGQPGSRSDASGEGERDLSQRKEHPR